MSIDFGAFNQLLHSGDFATAHTLLDSQPADSVTVQKLRADCHYRASDFAGALDRYLHLGAKFPAHIDQRYHLADCCAHLGMRELACLETQRMVERAGLKDGSACQVLAEAWMPLGLDDRILGLTAAGFKGELNRHVFDMMRAQSLMRSNGIAQGVHAYRESYCSPQSWAAMYPQAWQDFNAIDAAGYWWGQKELPGILRVHSRGGWGDFLQWMRYIPALESVGVRVFVRETGALHLCGGDSASEGDLLAQHGFDVADAQRVMWTEPFTLFTSLFPVLGYAASERYLRADAVHPHDDTIADIRHRAQGKPCVGLFWSANESPDPFARRSMRLQHLTHLLAMEDVHWVIFQRGHQRSLWMQDPRSRDGRKSTLAPAPDSFVDSLVLASRLDAMVSVDSGLAHGAAALSRPCLMLLNDGADWRWEQCDSSPWYPTMDIVRAPSLGAWDEVDAKAAEALRHRLS